jgi:hypothetical protein
MHCQIWWDFAKIIAKISRKLAHFCMILWKLKNAFTFQPCIILTISILLKMFMSLFFLDWLKPVDCLMFCFTLICHFSLKTMGTGSVSLQFCSIRGTKKTLRIRIGTSALNVLCLHFSHFEDYNLPIISFCCFYFTNLKNYR